MKILHVISSIAPRYGGPSKQVLELCRELAKQGHEITIFTTDINGDERLAVPLGQPVEMDGFTIRYFPVQWPRYYKFSFPLGKALRKEIPLHDVVHIHSLYLFHSVVAAHYCRRFGIPYLIRPHGTLHPFIQKTHPLRKRVYNLLFEKHNLDCAAGIHYATLEEMRLTAPLKIKAPGVVIPNGINPSEYTRLPECGSFRKRYPEIGDKKILLFLGRIHFGKGLGILVRALEKVARERKDVYLVLAGPDNKGYSREVKKWLDQAGLANRSLFTGMLLGKDKLSLLRDSDIFVLPSYSDSFGIAVIEAMACRLPVVISNKVGIWQEVAETRAGIVTNCDSQQVAEAILKLLANPEMGKEMGKRGEELVRSRFTWSKVIEKLIRVYQDIISERANARD